MGIKLILVTIILGTNLCEEVSSNSIYPVAVRLHPLQTSNSLDQYTTWEEPQYDTNLSPRFQYPVVRPFRISGRPSRELVPISTPRLPHRNHQPQSYVLAMKHQPLRPYLMSDSLESEETEDEDSQQQQDYVGSAYYPDYIDYDHDDDDDDEDEVPKKKKKKKLTKFEKIDRFIDKIHNKIYDKYLHIKEKKPPEPPDWAKDKFANTAPEIELPPWENYIRKK